MTRVLSVLSAVSLAPWSAYADSVTVASESLDTQCWQQPGSEHLQNQNRTPELTNVDDDNLTTLEDCELDLSVHEIEAFAKFRADIVE